MRKRMLLSVLVTSAALAAPALIWADEPAPHGGSSSTTAPTTRPAETAATKPAGGPQPTAQPQTSEVKRGSLSITIDQQAGFEPVDAFEVRIRPKAYQGEMTITRVVPSGSSVRKGDVLLEIDPAVIKRMIAAADNDQLNARAALTRAEADAKVSEEAEALAEKQQKAALKESQDALKWFENMDGPQYLRQIDLTLQQLQDQVKDAEDELDQLKKMYKSEELTNATADIVVRRALRNLELSKQYYSMMDERATKARTFTYPMLKQRYVDGAEQAKQQYALFETAQTQQKVARQTGLAAVRAAAAAAELRDNELKSDLEKFTVRATTDGTVSYGQVLNGNWQGNDPRMLRVGERAMPQAILMTLFTPGKLRLVIDLPESRYFAIKPDQKASISPVAFPELKYEGLCEPPESHAPAAAMGGGYALHIATGEVDSRILPGMKATIHMDVPLADDALLVPTTAVANSTVWVHTSSGKDESRHVLTGRSDGKSIEILSGVHEGDHVLTHAKAS